MTSASMVLVLLAGLVGIMLWIIGVIALDIFGINHPTHDKRHRTAAPEPHDGYEPPDAHHVSPRL